VIKRDEILQVPQDGASAAQVELDTAPDRELNFALLVAECDSGE
jgi:hypothetical protein